MTEQTTCWVDLVTFIVIDNKWKVKEKWTKMPVIKDRDTKTDSLTNKEQVKNTNINIMSESVQLPIWKHLKIMSASSIFMERILLYREISFMECRNIKTNSCFTNSLTQKPCSVDFSANFSQVFRNKLDAITPIIDSEEMFPNSSARP